MTPSFATDAAALADDVRDRVPVLAELLVDEREREDRVALLVLARTYADRVARAAAGAVLLALTTATLVSLAFAAVRHGWVGVGHDRRFIDGGAFVAWTSCFEHSGYLLGALGIATVVASFARRRAMQYFTRAVTTPDPIASGRDVLARAEPWFAAAWTSGAVMFCAYVGIASAFGSSAIAEDVFGRRFSQRSR